MNYKLLLVVPALLLVIAAGMLVNGYLQSGEWFLRSIDLKGGTLITVPGITPENVSLERFGARVRGIGNIGILIEMPADVPVKDVIATLGVPEDTISVQTIGPSLGEAFWRQAQIGIVIAFILMGIVVFFLFRKIVPSFAVIFAAVSDIIVTLAFMQLFGIQLSLAGLAALLMLIGYSVDTDILLTSRMFKGEGTIRTRLIGALKTGITMSLTTIAVLVVLVIMEISVIISQIAIVLLIGLAIDIVNTWLMNSVVLRWYVERRGI